MKMTTYLFRSVPSYKWNRLKAKSAIEGKTIREKLLELVDAEIRKV